MQINNISATNSTNFGMALLTQRGTRFATEKLGDLPKYVDQTVYKKNILGGILTDMMGKNTEKYTMQDINDVFDAGHTAFADKNAAFANKQILGSKKTIAQFLKSKIKLVKGPEGSKYQMDPQGQVLVGRILNIFDENVANPNLSAKKGSQILQTVSEYIPNDELAPRHAIVTNKLFNKK